MPKDTRNYGKNHPRFLRGGAVFEPRERQLHDLEDTKKDDEAVYDFRNSREGTWADELERREKLKKQDAPEPEREPYKQTEFYDPDEPEGTYDDEEA